MVQEVVCLLLQVFCFISSGLFHIIHIVPFKQFQVVLKIFQEHMLPSYECFLHFKCFASILDHLWNFIYSRFEDISTPLPFYFLYILSFTLQLLCHKGISGLLHWYYIVCSTTKSIFSCTALPRASFLQITCNYQWIFYIIMCTYTLSDYTIFHSIQGIVLHAHFMLFIFCFEFPSKSYLTPEMQVYVNHVNYSLYSKCQMWNYMAVTHYNQEV